MKKLIFLIILFFLLLALPAATAPGDIGNNASRAWRTR